MAVIDISKLQANLMTDNTSGDKQVLESTIMAALPIMFGEMPSYTFTNQTGSTDAAGNITFYKTVIPENNVKDFTKIGDLSRFKNLSSDKILVALDEVIENPVQYYSHEVAMGAQGILQMTEQGMTMNMAEAREVAILLKEWEVANTAAATQVKNIYLEDPNFDRKALERLMDETISQIRLTKDTGVNKVPLSRLVIKIMPVLYQRLLEVKLVIPGAPSKNEEDFTNGKFSWGRYKGVIIVEDVYCVDANADMLGSIQMIGSVAAPWRPEGVANDRVPGESAIYLLNTQVRFKIKEIYAKHIVVFKFVAGLIPGGGTRKSTKESLNIKPTSNNLFGKGLRDMQAGKDINPKDANEIKDLNNELNI